MIKGKYTDLTGQKFGLLTAVEPIRKSPSGDVVWKCLCECGNYSMPWAQSLKKGTTISCGCERIRRVTASATTHGKSYEGAYRSWAAMMRRCYNEKDSYYKDYGGRGITVDPRWHDLNNFLEDMGDRPENFTLERLDNNLAYSKANCEWASLKTQARNRRNTRRVLYEGKEYALIELVEKFSVPYRTALARLNRGWSVERTFEIRQL